MLLDSLIREVANIRSLISIHRLKFSQSETATRLSLIDPLLRALGWDTADPSRVSVEHDVAGKRIDYVLLGYDGNPVAGVEAKKLHEPLGEFFDTMVQYSVLLKAPYFVMTNGNNWQLFTGFLNMDDAKKKAEIDRHRVFSVSTSSFPRKFGLKLSSLWRPDFELVPPIPATEMIFWPASRFPAPRGWTKLTDVDVKGPKPSAIMFPDGTEKTVMFWWQLVGH